MPININDKQFYQTAEACQFAGISKNTYLRWVREGTISDVLHRDRRGWRIFTDEDLQNLKTEANKTTGAEGNKND